MLKNLKTRCVFEKYKPDEKNIIFRIVLPFNFTLIWEKFGSNWLIGYIDKKNWRKCLFTVIYQFIRKVWPI